MTLGKIRRVVGIIITASVVSCAQPAEPLRLKAPDQNLGESLYTEFCNRIAYEEDPSDVMALNHIDTCWYGAPPTGTYGPQLAAWYGERERFISAVNDGIPESIRDELQDFLTASKPLTDSDLVPSQTRALAALLTSIAASPEALQALAVQFQHKDYVPVELQWGLPNVVMGYPEVQPMLDHLLAAIGPQGPAHAAWNELLSAMQAQLQNTSNVSNDSILAWQEFLLTEHAGIYNREGVPMLKCDARGIATVALVDNALPEPFVDFNNDGLADVNVSDQFVDSLGQVIPVDAPFGFSSGSRDPSRRALNASGRPIYVYGDATRTLLAGMLYSAGKLSAAQPGMLFDLLLPLQATLGAQSTRTHTYDNGTQRSFQGYDVANTALFHTVQALQPFLEQPFSQAMIDMPAELLRNEESEIAELLQLGANLHNWYDDSKSLKEDNTMFDDLLPVLQQITANEDLLRDVMRAMMDPQTQRLGPLFGAHMQFKDPISFNPKDLNGPPLGTFATPVDRRGENFGNQSIFQRAMYLIANAHDFQHRGRSRNCADPQYPCARLCNKQDAEFGFVKYAACDLFEIEDMGEFYLEAVAGTAEMGFKPQAIDELIRTFAAFTQTANIDFDPIEFMSGIHGMRLKPTPAALNRFLFAPLNENMKKIVDPAVGVNGRVMRSEHADTIFAWELGEFFSALKPLAQAFVRHDRADLLLDMMSVMHNHWSEISNERTGLVRFEPLIAQLLTDGRATYVLGNLLRAAKYEGYEQTLIDAARYALPAGDTHATPLYKLADSLSELGEVFEANVPAKDALKRTLTNVVDTLLVFEDRLSGKRFRDRRVKSTVETMLLASSDAMRKHGASGFSETVKDALEHPLTASMLQLALIVGDDAEVRTHMDKLVQYLLQETATDRNFTTVAATSANVIQSLAAAPRMQPLFVPMAQAFTPETGSVALAMEYLRQAPAYDPTGVLPRLTERLTAPRPGKVPALTDLMDIVVQMNRVQPGSHAAVTPADVHSVATKVSAFLVDKDWGLENFYDLIKDSE